MYRVLIVVFIVVALMAASSLVWAATPDEVRQVARDFWVPGSYVRMTADRSELPAARELRSNIALLLDAGLSDSDIRDVMVERYGESILAAPPAHGVNLTAWIMPALVLLVGTILVTRLLTKWVGNYEARRPA